MSTAAKLGQLKTLWLKGKQQKLRCNLLTWRNTNLDAKDDDVILLINPRYSIQVFLEETESSLGSITSIVKANAQKYFFCENSYDFAGIKAIKLYKSYL